MKKKLAIVFATVAVLLAAGAFLLASADDRLHAKSRKEWKTNAIAEISRKVADTNWLAAEQGTLKGKAAKSPLNSECWLSGHLISMANGDWIVYSSKCSKEDRRIHDIFIGRASDGKWYYSTFHFCIGMLVLKMEPEQRPESLAKFVEAHFLRQFDGQSDDCLRKTWPPRRA